MQISANGPALAICAICLIAACSKSASGPAQSAASNSARATSTAATPPGSACDRKMLGPGDVAGILDEPITGTKPLKGDPQTCYFITATNDQGGPEVMVSLRPGLGAATLATFTSEHMNDYAKWKPLAGVGDEAVWLPELHEIDARKNDLLCVVSAHGISKTLRDAGTETQQKNLGALCNKIFSVY
jgi:hypothetical protein